MLRPRLIAALAAVLLCLLPAAAHARSVTLSVGILDDSGTPTAGAKVEILDMQGNKLGSGTVGADGNVRITIERPDGVDPDGGDKVLIETDAKNAQGRGTFAVVDLTDSGPLVGIVVPPGSSFGTGADFVDLIKGAVARCDKAAYDRWVGELNRKIAGLEKDLDDAQQAADSFARNNELRVTDLKGAQKDLKRAEEAQAKLDPSLRNDAVLNSLGRYINLLRQVDAIKRSLNDARRARESVPPFPEDCKKDKKVGLVPGVKTCPDGSGGLLAGVLNEAFDSDIDPACEDESNRRDTDRPKKDRERRERHRD